MTKTRHRARQRYIRRHPQWRRFVMDPFLAISDVIHDPRHRWDEPQNRENSMEWDLLQSDWMLEKVCSSEHYAQNLYAAMCNRDFIKNEIWTQLKGEPRWSCSWRYAGGIIAEIRQEGDYMDWYCSGIRSGDEPDVYGQPFTNGYVHEGCVTDEIRADLLRLGWTVLDDDM